ncbi:MAG: serine hydrolase [Vicinamibacterales bacterium]
MRRLASLALAAAITTACTAQAPTRDSATAATPAATPKAPASLQALIDAEMPTIPSRAGIWVKHLTTGEEAAFHADDVFNSASVIKIPVAVLALEMADAGTLKLANRLTIRAEDVRGGSGVFRYHDPGLQPTLRDVLLQMIITSDNTATDLSIAQVGGVAKVNAWLAAHGYADGMKLVQTTGELFAKYAALAPSDDRNAKTNGDHAYWLGELTPRATGRMLAAIEARTLPSKAGADELVRMFRAQQSGARRLPHFLPPEVSVGHKTGDFPPVLANDVGIVYAKSGPIVVSFFQNAITEPYGEAEDRMGRLAAKIVAYFDK